MTVALRAHVLDVRLLRTVHELRTKRDFLHTVYGVEGKGVEMGSALKRCALTWGFGKMQPIVPEISG